MSRQLFYKLVGKKPVPDETNGKWMSNPENTKFRVVGVTETKKSTISTVFLGLNHSFINEQPIFFETLVLSGPLKGEVIRYQTWNQAEKGHKEMVERVIAAEKH